ncbi:MAG TPA: Zn-ribbon domain-containing OB-fold protein [Micropepsaceae bacterium]|nr:Zn-ribbon domain-containing OB-fold protein [Micropepsaceae bacterium]
MTNAEKKLEKPVPRPAPESRPFWEGAKRKKLMLPHCDKCGKFWFPPSQRCPHCLSLNFQWREAKGEGRIYSFVVYHRVYHPAFEADVPYVVAIVELDEGPRLLTNIVDAPENVRCDARVRVRFEEASSDFVLPKFALLP